MAIAEANNELRPFFGERRATPAASSLTLFPLFDPRERTPILL